MKKNIKCENSNYIIYIDILKILASFAVVFIHVISTLWYSLLPNTNSWLCLNLFDSISRWCVPVFVMCTGLLLLNNEKKFLFIKHFSKASILLVFWVIFFAIFNMWINKNFCFKDFLYSIQNSYYHLWYLYLLISLYIITPILKLFINKENKKILKYILILWFIINTINYISLLPNFAILKSIFSKFDFSFISGYIGYYILGYYLDTFNLNKKTHFIFYILGFLSTICVFLSTKFFALNYPDLKRNFL